MTSIDIDLQQVSQHPDIPQADLFAVWVKRALKNFRDNSELSIRIVDEMESQSLNAQYRGKDKPTNVLSFPFDVPPGIPASEMNHLLGDLVICAPVVAREAIEQKKPTEHHWAHMVIHGTLHLLGFDHINDDEALEMEQLERDILAELTIPDPYFGEHEDLIEP